MEPSSDLDRLAHHVIGAAIEVHRELGPGYLESVYEQALAIESTERKIAYEQQRQIGVDYKGHPVGSSRLDLIVEDKLVVELKAIEQLLAIHKAQLISYLKTTGYSLGLLIDFNVEVLKHGVQRVVLTK